jgi:hypothetical protein
MQEENTFTNSPVIDSTNIEEQIKNYIGGGINGK